MMMFPLNQNMARLILNISLASLLLLFLLCVFIFLFYGEIAEPSGLALIVVKILAAALIIALEATVIILLIDSFHFLRAKGALSVENILFLIIGNTLAAYWFYYKKWK